MTVSESFRRQVIDALREGDGTPAMVYADWLQDNDADCPEFFRLLGKKAAEYPEWLVRTWTAVELCGGRWDCGTAANSYISRSVGYALQLLSFERPFDRGTMWFGVPPPLADRMARSMEIRDFLYYYGPTYWGSINDRQRRVWQVYGLPPFICGLRVWVFDAGTVPDDYAVLIDERVKVLALITECVE